MILLALAACWAPFPAAADPVLLHAAGDLRAALDEVAAYSAGAEIVTVATESAASGTLREVIEDGEAAQVFGSATMGYPRRLAEADRAGPVALVTRNSLSSQTRGISTRKAASVFEQAERQSGWRASSARW